VKPNEQSGDTFSPATGKYTRLRAVRPSDTQWLYELTTGSSVAHRWRLRGSSISPSGFDQFLWHDVQIQMIGEALSSGERAGLFQMFGHDPMSGFAHLSAIVPPHLMRRGWPFEALLLFVDLVFRSWDVRKLYLESPEFVAVDYAAGAGELLHEEGRLKAHYYWDDQFWDQRIFAIYRDTWRASRGDLIVHRTQESAYE